MIYFVIVGAIVLIDQLSKGTVIKNMAFGEEIKIIGDFFYIVHWKNSGAAFGILENSRVFFIVFTIIVSILIGYYIYKLKNRTLRIALAFILGGAIGNLIDRILIGSVTDFLDFHIFSYHYPTFNVADSFIVIGSVCVCIYVLFIDKDKEVD